jgi:hypothetical protein
MVVSTCGLGDKMSGYLAEEKLTSMAEILPWLQEAIAHLFPVSAYASPLGAGTRERGAKRIFQPARVRATAKYPRCGAPDASPGFDKLMISYCARCGNSVEVKEPPVN